MESERMLHPIIGEEGVATQNEVVKEEKRLRYDNSPYGRWLEEVTAKIYTKHPYKIEDGIFFAHKTTVNMGPQNIDFNLKEIQINPEVPDHLFE